MADQTGVAQSRNPPSDQLTRHLVRLDDRRAALRCELELAVGVAKSIAFEVGCGHGHFLAAYADAHPAQLCLGVDIASDRIARANRKRERAGIANLHFLRADANLVLDVLPPSVTLACVFLLFPDPWPKLRHHKHRVAQPEFFSRIAERLGEDGRLYFRTDHLPYFEFVRTELRTHPHLATIDEPWRFEFPTVFQNRAAVYHSLVARRRPPRA